MLVLRLRVTVTVIALSVLLSGCLGGSLSFSIRFAELDGLKEQDSVYFEQNEIGQVDNISYTSQGDYLVEVNIKQDFKNTATVDSRFFIGYDPMNQQKKAVIVVQEKAGGTLIEKDSIVEGSVRPGYLGEIISGLREKADQAENKLRQSLEEWQRSMKKGSADLNKQLSESLDDLSGQFQSFKEGVKKVPESDEVKRLEESVRQFADEFDRAQKDVRDHLREEVIPQLRQELDKLREQLEKEGREEEMDEIDKQMNRVIVV